MADKPRTAEQLIARLASRSHGTVSRQELLAVGLTRHEIHDRVGRGLLIPVYRGVYRAGHTAPSLEARYAGAVKACGEGTRLCGRAAARLQGLVKGAPPPEVLCPRERRVRGILTHRCRRIDPRDTGRVVGIPITTVPRTLVDLAAVLPVDALARAAHEAGVKHRTTPGQVAAVLARTPNAKGARDLRLVLDLKVPVSLSRLESAFFARLRYERLPLPETNRSRDGRRVDCRWPRYGLTVELNGYRFHNSRRSWEEDRQRERAARARGEEFRTFTWADVREDSSYMLGELRGLLGPERLRTAVFG